MFVIAASAQPILTNTQGKARGRRNCLNSESTTKEPDSENWCDGSHAFVFPPIKYELKSDLSHVTIL